MSNLFSVFVPQSWLGFNLNWFSRIGVLLVIPPLFWAAPSQSSSLASNLIKKVGTEFKAILSPSSLPGVLSIPLSLLTIIGINNVFGLSPYIFTASSHLVFTLTLALPLWLGHMLWGWLKTPGLILAHLLPLGTPGALMPFMVGIELTSSLIRPLTLAIRLAANIIAGHLLISLLSRSGVSTSLAISSLVITSLVALSILECAVSLIQAYVFRVLSTLYLSEVESPGIV